MPVTMNGAALGALGLAPGVAERAVERGRRGPSASSAPVEPRALGPDVLSTPCASVQQMYEMLGVVSETYAGRPFACAFASGAARSRPVPREPAVPTAAIVTCSASEVASSQIVWPTLNGVTLVTFTFVAPTAAAAASVVPATLPERVEAEGTADRTDVVTVGAGAVVEQGVDVLAPAPASACPSARAARSG